MSKSFDVPKKVRDSAKRGLELREKYGRGGLSTTEAGEMGIGSGVQRANDLIEGSVSYETVKRMLAFFRRHEVYKKEGHHKKEGSASLISWLLWGGDAGYKWARDIIQKEEGIAKGSLLEKIKLGDEPEWEKDDDDTLDPPSVEVSPLAKGLTFMDRLTGLRNDYRPIRIEAVPPKEIPPEPVNKEETPIESFTSRLKKLAERVDRVVTPISETVEVREELKVDSTPEVDQPAQVENEETQVSSENIQVEETIIPSPSNEVAAPEGEQPTQEEPETQVVPEPSNEEQEVSDSSLPAQEVDSTPEVDQPTQDIPETQVAPEASSSSEEPLSLSLESSSLAPCRSGSPEGRPNLATCSSSEDLISTPLKQENHIEDPLVKNYFEGLFGKWISELESKKKSESGTLKIFDRKDFPEVFMTVKKVGFASSPLISGKIKKLNRQLKRGVIDLNLIPLAIKTIELKPDSTEALLCGGQAFLNLLGNLFYDSVFKNKKRVNTDNNRISHPAKYFEGLDPKTVRARERVIEERMKQGIKPPKLYEDLPGDDEIETEASEYSKTDIANKVREEIKKPGKIEFIRATAKVSGIDKKIIEQVYDRGMKAWATSGHRPGATAQQWAIARVYSFISGGKTQSTADKDLWEQHLDSTKEG